MSPDQPPGPPQVPATAQSAGPEAEAARICQDLIRIDTSNYGDGSGPGERAAAEHVMGLLTQVGLEPTYLESAPGRANVVVRMPGTDPSRPALAIHGHLDVVPADASHWQVDPFSGEERDGYLWGRGAVDMKNMDAMMLAVIRDVARRGVRPPRDIVWAFFADEEAGGRQGAGWLVDHHPELFEGVSEAISEVGGFSVTAPTPAGPRRAYLVQTAEKGIAWLRLVAHGQAGHGSLPNPHNAVARLAAAVTRVVEHPWPRSQIVSVAGLLDGLTALTGVGHTEQDCAALLACVPSVRPFVEATLRDTANPTMLTAGYKHNVIPQTATAALDCRFLPGRQEELLATIRDLAGEHVEVIEDHVAPSLEAPFEAPLVAAMAHAVTAEDPGAAVLPYCLSGGTDNKSLARLGVRGYGFAPLRLPADLPFAALFHGVDERVPLDGLRFGTRVLRRLVDCC